MGEREYRRKLTPIAVLVAMGTACARNAPQDVLNPQGPIARDINNLFRPVFWIAVAVFVIVEGLIVFAILRFRDREGRSDPQQTHGNSRLEIAWTIAPALVLAAIAFPTVATIFRLSASQEANQVKVKVIGHQWWWEYRYEDAQPEIVTANELVIPVDRPVFLELESADVIHSFWVPELAGKQDVVPGRTNALNLLADKPGEYYGQCAEFCALSHANMRLRVIAKEEADFERWVRNQQSPPIESAETAQGRNLFFSSQCIQCHAISGTQARGTLGPDLTHFASRGTFAGSMFDRNEENLRDWIARSPELKPGSDMPFFRGILTDEEIALIARYLETLR